MGRKRKGVAQEQAIWFLLAIGLIIGTIIVMLVYIGGFISIVFAIGVPLFLLFSILYSLIKMNQINVRAKGSISDYWLSSEEKEEFKFLFQEWSDACDKVNKIESVHDYAREKGISQNIDGSYSKRSEVGKSITSSLANLERQLEIAKDIEDRCFDEYILASKKPLMRWQDDFLKLQEKDFLYRKIKMASISLIFMAGIAVVLYMTGYNQMIVDEYIRKPIEQLVSQDIFLFGRETVLELLFHSYFKFIILLLISGICSLILY